MGCKKKGVLTEKQNSLSSETRQKDKTDKRTDRHLQQATIFIFKQNMTTKNNSLLFLFFFVVVIVFIMPLSSLMMTILIHFSTFFMVYED